MRSSITAEVDAKGTPAREVFDGALQLLGLACKLDDGVVMVTSIKSFSEPLFPGHHGEMFCDHGEWVRIRYSPPGPRRIPGFRGLRVKAARQSHLPWPPRMPLLNVLRLAQVECKPVDRPSAPARAVDRGCQTPTFATFVQRMSDIQLRGASGTRFPRV